MGLFISDCPGCGKDINWFLAAPKNYKCSCGRAVSVEEIEQSWTEKYARHMEEVNKHRAQAAGQSTQVRE